LRVLIGVVVPVISADALLINLFATNFGKHTLNKPAFASQHALAALFVELLQLGDIARVSDKLRRLVNISALCDRTRHGCERELHVWQPQRRYFGFLVEDFLLFCSAFGTAVGVKPMLAVFTA